MNDRGLKSSNHKFITFDETVKFRGILEFCGYQLTQLSMTDTDRLDNIIKELQEARALMKNKK